MAIFKVGSDRPSPDEIRQKFLKNKEDKTKLLTTPIDRPMEDPNLVSKPSTSSSKVEISPEAKAIHQSHSTTITVTVTPGGSEEVTQAEVPTDKKEVLHSDIKKNEPNDPVTKEKLKAILTNGAFNFKPEERKALNDILGSKS